MGYKVGDIVLCKIDGNMTLTFHKYYEITRVEKRDNKDYVIDLKNDKGLSESYFPGSGEEMKLKYMDSLKQALFYPFILDLFYSKEEERLLKLKKLNGKR